jgi:hypothetical protein
MLQDGAASLDGVQRIRSESGEIHFEQVIVAITSSSSMVFDNVSGRRVVADRDEREWIARDDAE